MIRIQDGYPYRLPQPAGAITYQLNGAQVGRGNILNLEGSGINFVASGDKGTYILGGGGAGSPSGLNTEVQYNNAGAFGSDGDFVRDPGGTFFGVNSTIAVGKEVRYVQDSNIFGLGIDGVLNAYSTNFGASFIGTLSGDFTGGGGADNSMIVGYQSFIGGAVANTNYGYDSITDNANVRIEASTLTSQARLELQASGSIPSAEFNFGGGNSYLLPITSPTVGTALGYVSANTLGWVSVGGGGLNIGDPITGGTNNRILYEDGSGNLAESGNLFYNETNGLFQVNFGGGVLLQADPSANRYGLGDLNALNNKNYIDINDGSQVLTISASDLFQVYDSTSVQWMKLDVSSFTIGIGDVGNVQGGNRILVVDQGPPAITAYISDRFQVLDRTANFRYLDINPTSNNYAIGDMNGEDNFTYLNINDFSMQVFVQTGGDFGVQDIGGRRGIDVQMGGGIGTFIVGIGDANLTGNGTRLSIDDAARTVVVTNRFEQSRGAMVTAANNTTLGLDGNVFFIDGSTTINLIERTGWQNGSEVTLMLPGGITLKHNFSPSGSFNPMILAGGVDLTTLNDTVIKLLYTNGLWYQSAGAVSQP